MLFTTLWTSGMTFGACANIQIDERQSHPGTCRNNFMSMLKLALAHPILGKTIGD